MPKGRILIFGTSSESDLLADLLREVGYDPAVVRSFDRARDLVSSGRPDGVLVEVELPAAKSLELCSFIAEQTPTVPSYAILASEDSALVDACLQSGARNVLCRPLTRAGVELAARSLMNLRSLLLQGPAREDTGRVRERAPTAPPAGSDVDLRARFFQFELFKRLLVIELKRARRYGFPLSLALVAPDGTPAPALTTGSGSADFTVDTVTLVGRAVSAGIRDIDIPVNLGEDDFLVVMPHTDADGARVVAERIRRRARSPESGVTVSIGVTSVAEGGRPTFQSLMERASKALREARRLGGDRTATV